MNTKVNGTAAPKLSERALLARLRIGMFSATRQDKEIAEEVNEAHKAEADAGTFLKKLFPREALREVNNAYVRARNAHRVLTLPWDDDGTRILAATTHKEYTTQMKAAQQHFNASADRLVQQYPELIKMSKARMGTMFNADDYPEPDEVRAKFYIDVELRPMPEATDFRAKVGDDSMKAIVRDIERRQRDRLETAMNNVFEQIKDHTDKMVDKLTNFKSIEEAKKDDSTANIFRDSLVYNIKGLVDVLPSLNITDDPRIIKLQQKLNDELLEYSPEELRVDPRKRHKIAKRAQAITDKVSQYMS